MKIVKRGALRGEIKIPADKSITHRAIIIGSIGAGVVEVENYLAGADCLSTLSCMEKLGVKIERAEKSLLIHGAGLRGLETPTEILDAGNSGTTLRLLMGLL
ncbi:MAG: 3-phosphoshikimate 1-carboxyvinyltransferase, partial [Selenomonadaceae bacterium]|nr:3-phosphoshikimate 1-carboxyvinyltransferase [Selenomonadaceae bacterium]